MLKEIRRQIARANDIEFVTAECKHKGDCAGTCPKCESEVAYLEEQLARRRRLGLTTRVAGLALGLAAIAPVGLVDSCTKGDLIGPEQLQGDVPSDSTMGIVGPDQPSEGQDGQEGQDGEDNSGGQD
jgi:hypothetical protein